MLRRRGLATVLLSKVDHELEVLLGDTFPGGIIQ